MPGTSTTPCLKAGAPRKGNLVKRSTCDGWEVTTLEPPDTGEPEGAEHARVWLSKRGARRRGYGFMSLEHAHLAASRATTLTAKQFQAQYASQRIWFPLR